MVVVLSAIGMSPALAVGQNEDPTIEWQRLFGGSGDDLAFSIQHTSDGGYIFLGNSVSSASGNITDTNHGDHDLWLVKTDGTGSIQWQRLLGGSGWDEGCSVQQTTDGGYIVLGPVASSANGDVTGVNHGGYDSWGGYDLWVVKLTSTGTIQWQQLLGGFGNDYGRTIRQTADGGYVLVGYTFASLSGDVTGQNHGSTDFWVVKLTSTGTIQWQRLLGGSGFETGICIRQTVDEGYILIGESTSSASGDVTSTNHGGYDVWVVKLTKTGTIQWQQLLGGSADDHAYSIDQTTDGGYIFVGETTSNGTGTVISGNHGGLDIWVVKLNSTGSIKWQKLLGGSGTEYGHSVQQTADGGYVLLGQSDSSANGDVSDTNHGSFDSWVVKLNDMGQILWQKLVGGTGYEHGNFLDQSADGGVIIAGHSESSASGDVTGTNHGGWDVWVVKLKTGHDLPLSPGWNFVSVPAVLAPGSDTAALFAGVDTDAHGIFQYNASSTTWERMTPTTKVKPLDGIWIYSKDATTVPLSLNSNPQAVPPAKDLALGWNAIGYASSSPATAKDALSSVAGKWSTLLGFNAGTQQYDIPIYTGSSGMYTDTREMVPGKGYWLWMRESGLISGPGV
jgi:hypothetical protein